eukprot:COSAG02_NODE_6179_length_3748_cov_786.322849_3_plen_71_part_00
MAGWAAGDSAAIVFFQCIKDSQSDTSSTVLLRLNPLYLEGGLATTAVSHESGREILFVTGFNHDAAATVA